MEQSRHDLVISGMGKAGGGSYQHVRIDGMGTINHDTNCVSMTANGRAHVMGSLQSQTVTANGTLSVSGAVHADRIVVDGLATMKDDVVCQDSFEVNGRVSIEKNLRGEKVKVDGSLKTRGDVQCETFSVNGGFSIEGLLNAGQVDIKLNFPCRAHEIGGERITVKRTKKFRVLEQLTGTFAARLKANVIEGDYIELEYTDADTVRGNEVRIGPGCQIRLVEYKHEMIQDPDAKIGSIQQV